jgi:nucleoid DNA-binding protein
MDIGKYIGKFLIKNKYCSLSGLGVFELKKIPAYEQKGEISNPAHQVTFTPVGSIDDTFASFIASFENVSISNAANNIKEYCRNAKEEIENNGKFAIENLGNLTSSNGKLVFHQNADLDLGLGSIPVTLIEIKPINPETQEKIKENFSYPPANTTYLRSKQINWIKILVTVLGVVVLGVAAYFGYNYYKNNLSTNNETNGTETTAVQIDTIATSTVDTTAILASDTLQHDTTSAPTPTTNDSIVASVKPVAIGKEYKVSIFTYKEEASAIAKVNKLNRYGNKSSVVNLNGQFMVALTASNLQNDTTKLVDSLRLFFNPKGQVHIIK